MRTSIPNRYSKGRMDMNFIRKNNYLFFVMILFIGFTMASIMKLENEVAYEQLVVTEGDTLWAYSVQYAEDVPQDIWINEIVKLNNLVSTSIQAGDELRIPVTPQKIIYNEIATNITGDEE